MNLRFLLVLIGATALCPAVLSAPKAPIQKPVAQKPKTLEAQLQTAIEQQNYNLAKSLLQRGAKTDKLGDPTPLWNLVLFNNEKDGKYLPDLAFIEWMLKNGVAWNAYSLQSVLNLSFPAAFDLFLAHGVEINGNYKFFRTESSTPLMAYVASGGDDPDFVRHLIERGADVNVTSKSGTSILQQAADINKADEIALIKIVLDAGAKPRPTDSQVIECSVRVSDDQLLKRALELGIKAPKDTGLLQLLCSLETDSSDAQLIPSPELIKKRVECARLLIQAGVPVNGFNDRHETPIMCAVANGLQPELAELLLKNGAKPLLKSDPGDNIWKRAAPIRYLAEWDQRERPMSPTEKAEQRAILSPESTRTLELLLDAKVPIDMAAPGNETILMMCAGLNRAKILKFLIGRGAKLELRDNSGETALHIAVSNQSSEATQVLLDAKANIEARNESARTPLFNSLDSRNFLLLLNKGAKVNVTDVKGATPLIMACFGARGSSWVVNELLKRGANPNIRQKTGENPLIIAVTEGNPALTRDLIQAGADTKVRFQNKTLLQLAQTPSMMELQYAEYAKYPQTRKETAPILKELKNRRWQVIKALTEKPKPVKKT